MIVCPECEGKIQVDERVRVHEVLDCGDCRVELEVVSLVPLMVAIAPAIEEDWGE